MKEQYTKHVVPFSWVFLTNPVWEHTKVLYDSVLGPVLSQNQQLATFCLMEKFNLYLFNDDIMHNIPHQCHITTYVNIWSLGDVIPFWQENHMHASKHLSSNFPPWVCPLVRPPSNYFYRIENFDPGCTLWHSPPSTSAHPCIELTRIMIYWNSIINNYLECTKLRVKTRINYKQLLLTQMVTTTLQKHCSIKIR